MMRILLFNLLYITLLFSGDYLQLGNYKIYPYAPEGNRNWPTGYIHVTIDSSGSDISVDSMGTGITHQSFKDQYFNRVMDHLYAELDSFLVYTDTCNVPAWGFLDPAGVNAYNVGYNFIGYQGGMIRLFSEAYLATKESKYRDKAITLWDQIKDSSSVYAMHRYNVDSVLCQAWKPDISYQYDGSIQYNIDIGLYQIYEKTGEIEYYNHFKDVYDLTKTWIDTVDADTLRITSWLFAGTSPYRINHAAYALGFLEWATAKGFGNHSMSGDSLLWRLHNFFAGHIDSTYQLRWTYDNNTTTAWGYTNMELANFLDGMKEMQSAGYNEPYWDDWDYLIEGIQNDYFANSFKKGEGLNYTWPNIYLMAKSLGYTIDDTKFPNQMARTTVTQIYTPMHGFNHSGLGFAFWYAFRWYLEEVYYNLRYLKDYTNILDAYPALTDSIKDNNYTWDYIKFYNNSNVYRYPGIAALKFDLASFDSLTYNVVNDSSILEVSYFHEDTICTIRRISCGFFTEIECNYPTKLIIMNQVTGIYDATAQFFADTTDTTFWMTDMPTGKDTTITFADSTIIFIFDDDEYMAVKANGTDWIFNKDNATVISDFGITKAKINPYLFVGFYDNFSNRNYFLNNQFQIMDYVYNKSLGKLIWQMY